MLAARGVSLGLGKINLSDLNQLPKADRALLGKLKREQKAAEQKAQQAKVVVRKHVDSKTLWTACATVIVGAALMALGLVMTVVGYFDSDLFSSEPFLRATAEVAIPGQNSEDRLQQEPSTITHHSPVGWFRFVLKSMQYLGPVLMGVGMFLLIVACVMTLESRDRHAQIMQEESTELRRSRRPTVQRTRSERSVRTVSGVGAADFSDDQRIRENGAAGGRSSPPLGRPSSSTPLLNETRLLVRAEVHAVPDPLCSQRKRLLDLTEMSDASSTDVMAEYTFPNPKTPLAQSGGTKRFKTVPIAMKKDEGKDEARSSAEIQGKAENEEKPWPSSSSGFEAKSAAAQRRKSSTAIMQQIRRMCPRGPAPLVRVESLMELSLSGSSPPTSTFGTPRKKGQI